MLSFFRYLGQWVFQTLGMAGYCVLLLVRTSYWLQPGTLLQKRREIVTQMYVVGVQSFVVVIAFATMSGMVLALQTGTEIARYGAEGQLGTIVTVSMVREFGPLMTAIVLLGRVGASMAAEIGTMKVSEEIDALESMAIDPVKFLVMPRELAMAVIAPVLTLCACAVGILGGAFVALAQVGLTLFTFYNSAAGSVTVIDLCWTMGKASIFGITIATVACGFGMRASGGALGVGQASRNTVVTALLLIIFINYILSSMYFVIIPAPPTRL